MQSNKNRVVVACAGSRKTTFIVDEALALPDKRILITTYTNDNIDQIKDYFFQRVGAVPANVTVVPWYTFLLGDCVRPYQNHMVTADRVRTIFFGQVPHASKFVKKANTERYFLADGCDIYSERMADFVCECDQRSGGLVMKRLSHMFDYVFVDELQDLAGYDLDILQMLCKSPIGVLAVGDPRQATFSTNNSAKNKQFKKSHIIEWIKQKHQEGLLSLEERVECYRSNQTICDLADSLYPDMSKAVSKCEVATGHDGIFTISKSDVLAYLDQHKPIILRHSKKTDTMGLPALNIGLSKGKTFDRVLIFPTKPMLKFLKTRDPEDAGDSAKLYVAVTRARYSVTFVQG